MLLNANSMGLCMNYMLQCRGLIMLLNANSMGLCMNFMLLFNV